MGPISASIDIGTNTVLCLVGRRGADGALEILDDACATARLGEGLARDGVLSDAAIQRTVELVGQKLARARALGAGRVRAVGTAVLRRAADADRFLDACRAQLQLEVEVLSEAEEARLGHAGACGPMEQDVVMVDVGGGSTEVVSGGGSSCLSAPIGAVCLGEEFLGLGGEEPVEEGGLGAAVAAVAQACAVFPAGGAEGCEVVLIGGTATNLACLEAGAASFDPAAGEGLVLEPRVAARWMARLAELTVRERCELPIEADRAEILPAGLACIAGTLRRLEAGSARVTGRGLRHGVLAELLG